MKNTNIEKRWYKLFKRLIPKRVEIGDALEDYTVRMLLAALVLRLYAKNTDLVYLSDSRNEFYTLDDTPDLFVKKIIHLGIDGMSAYGYAKFFTENRIGKLFYRTIKGARRHICVLGSNDLMLNMIFIRHTAAFGRLDRLFPDMYYVDVPDVMFAHLSRRSGVPEDVLIERKRALNRTIYSIAAEKKHIFRLDDKLRRLANLPDFDGFNEFNDYFRIFVLTWIEKMIKKKWSEESGKGGIE